MWHRAEQVSQYQPILSSTKIRNFKMMISENGYLTESFIVRL